MRENCKANHDWSPHCLGQTMKNTLPEQLKILVAEDSAIYRRLIGDLLKEWGFDLVIARDGAEAWEVLQQPDAPRLVLLDWVLPHVDGVELCRRLRNAGSQHFYTYTVLLTAKDTTADLLEGMQAGADDYLIKPFEPLELKARLLAGKRILDLQQDLIEARESLRVAATYDALTKLLNRAEILRLLETELARCAREQKPVGLILADVDHFKTVNDSLGHSAGDAVLVEVAKRLKANQRIYDGVGRYGGEEFLLILPGCSLENTAHRAQETKEYVCREAIATPTSAIWVTVSMGVTAAIPDQKVLPEVLLSEADLALYRAKGNGRNRVEVHRKAT